MLLRINNSITIDKKKYYQLTNALIHEYFDEVTHGAEYVSSLKYRHSQELKRNKNTHVYNSIEKIRKIHLPSKNFFLIP